MSLPLLNTLPQRDASLLEYFWRIAIETDDNGFAERIVAVEVAEDGTTRTQYEIPFDAFPAYVAPVEPPRQEGRELPPPEVSIRSNRLDLVDEDDGEE
jgi:hypothetical protein